MTIDLADVEALLLRQLTDDEAQWFPRLIALVEGQLEGMLSGFSVSAGEETVDVAAHGGELWTPRYPVTEITSISIGDAVLSATSYEFTEQGHVTFGTRAILNEFEINMIDDWRVDDMYTVEYAYGFETLPGSVTAALASAVARSFRTAASGGAGVSQETLGSYSVTYEQTAAALLAIAAEELRPLRSWNRTRQVSVPLVRGR